MISAHLPRAVGACSDREARSQMLLASHRLPGFGITAADFDLIAADALDDEVLGCTPLPPTSADIRAILAGALSWPGGAWPRPAGTRRYAAGRQLAR
jgi:alcohol dehydrogenase class IV